MYGDNDQKRGSKQLLQHIYRKETGEFPVSDVILDNGESTVNLIQEIRNDLRSKFGQESTICTIFNIKTHVQNCLQKLVDHRCEDAWRYLNGQIETGDYVDVDKGDFQKIIETFRKRWTLCGVRNASKRCTKCHYCCLLVDGHATSDLPDNCLDRNDKHLCVKQCELEVTSGTNLNKCFRKCAEQAGHYEVDSADVGRLHKINVKRLVSKTYTCAENLATFVSPPPVMNQECVFSSLGIAMTKIADAAKAQMSTGVHKSVCWRIIRYVRRMHHQWDTLQPANLIALALKAQQQNVNTPCAVKL